MESATTHPSRMTNECLIPLEQNCDSPVEAPTPPISFATEARTARPSMRGIASSQISRGSQTCIVVGNLDRVEELDLSVHANILWFNHGASALPERFRVASRKLSIEPLEHTDSKRAATVVCKFIQLDATRLPSVFVTEEAVGELAPKALPIVEAIFAQCEGHQRSRAYLELQTFLCQKHVLANLPFYARRRVPRSWAGALKGVPAFVCGAGPSLDASAAKLAKYARHGVVFAADSAIRALDQRGIEVDFAIAIDARKTPDRCLPPGTRPPVRMIVASSCAPAWLQAVPSERLYFLSGPQYTESALAQLGVAPSATKTSRNCGTTAFDLAVYLGCHPICLFGMDHAFDSQEPFRLHSRDITQKLATPPPEKTYPKVPGNYQAEIATPIFAEWSYLDNRCAALQPGLVHNVIDRGARLRNTTLVHPDNFAADPTWPDKSHPLGQLAAAESIDEHDWGRLRDTVVRLARKAEKFITLARSELKSGRQQRAVQALATLFGDKQFVLIFGNYTTKMLPHFVRSAAANPQLWHRLIDECHELRTLAKNTC
jgi:hypothetical protein